MSENIKLRRDPITPQLASLLYGDFRANRFRYVTEWETDD